MPLLTDEPYLRRVLARLQSADATRVLDFTGAANPISETAQSGTGQSGTSALVNTAGLVLNGAYSLYLNEKTSSGAGVASSKVYTTRRPSVKRYRIFMRFRHSAPDALSKWDRIELALAVGNGTNVYLSSIVIDAGYNLTKIISYNNSAGTYTNTGLTWPGSGTYWLNSWHELTYVIDIDANKYLHLRLDHQELWAPGWALYKLTLATIMCQTSIKLFGNDNELKLNISELYIEETS